jgi:hypothetical protein
LEQLRTLWGAAMKTTVPDLPSHQQDLFKDRLSVLLQEYVNSNEALMPQKKIPNVKKFQVKALADYHPIFKDKGILKREYKPTFDVENYRNKGMNRYIAHQFHRLHRHLANPKTF